MPVFSAAGALHRRLTDGARGPEQGQRAEHGKDGEGLQHGHILQMAGDQRPRGVYRVGKRIGPGNPLQNVRGQGQRQHDP